LGKNSRAFKSAKRQKELLRQKKQEETRLRRAEAVLKPAPFDHRKKRVATDMRLIIMDN
jgi:hypothetical protein